MADPTDIERLDERIRELEAEQEGLRKQLAQAQIDQWEGRIDDLEVQVHLGTLEVADRLNPLIDALRNRWLDAKEQVGNAPGTTADVIDALRSGLEQAMKDIRTAVVDAKDAAVR